MPDLHKILFIDVETVPLAATYDDLDTDWQKLWDKKSQYFLKENETPSEVYNRAGIYAEFGKIVCISAGFISKNNEVRVKSFYSKNEVDILTEFAGLLNRAFNSNEHLLAAHNGKEFDFPYIARRMLINNLKLPNLLDLAGKKPWQIPHIDTLEQWKFGDYKHYTSLELLAKVFGIPTPKDDITGADVYAVYYQDDDLERIAQYCEKDVFTLIKLYLKQNTIDIDVFNWDNMPLLDET
jgi:uncharacterized protein YprB with RNaseH-like and TPR domain